MDIITTFYFSENKDRQHELHKTLISNIHNHLISKIHLFINSNDYLKFNNFIQNLNIDIKKIIFIKQELQPTYKDFIVYSSGLKNKIVCVCNNDIEFKSIDIYVLNKLKHNKIGYFISRHEHNNHKPLIDNFYGSYDAFIFYSTMLNDNIKNNSLETIHYTQNNYGIEGLLYLLFVDELGYTIYNPCYEIKLIHNHKNNVRGDYNTVSFYKKPGLIYPSILTKNNLKKKVFSVCLWGDLPMYNVGVIKNAELCKLYYPAFEYWVYIHKPSVPTETIEKLIKYKHVKLIYKEHFNTSPYTWRFEAIDEPNVDIMLSRNINTRILYREVNIINEWILSGKSFNIIRDHPLHTDKIMGGMFGTKKIKNICWKDLINKYIKDKNVNSNQILSNYIYPLIKNDVSIYSNFFKDTNETKQILTTYNEYINFIGEKVDENDKCDNIKKTYIINIISNTDNYYNGKYYCKYCSFSCRKIYYFKNHLNQCKLKKDKYILFCKNGLGDKLMDLVGALTFSTLNNSELLIVLNQEKQCFIWGNANYNIELFDFNLDINVNIVEKLDDFDDFNELQLDNLDNCEYKKNRFYKDYKIIELPISSVLLSPIRLYNYFKDTFTYKQIINIFVSNFQKIKPSSIIKQYIPKNIENSIGIHLRKSDKIRGTNNCCINNKDEFGQIIDNVKKYIITSIKNHNTTFFICSEDESWKKHFEKFIENEGGSILKYNLDVENYDGLRATIDMFCLSHCVEIVQGVKYTNFSICASLMNYRKIINYNTDPQCLTYLWGGCINPNKEYSLEQINYVDNVLKEYFTNILS